MNNLLTPEFDINNEKIEQIEIQNEEIINKSISNIKFNKVNFLDCKFDSIVFNNVTFQKCNLSNTIFLKCGLHSCKFIECKMIGSSFTDSIIKQTIFKEIAGRYIGFSYCQIHKVEIQNSDFTESRFIDLKTKEVTFLNDNLTSSEFNAVSLHGIDLSTCKIENILIDPKNLKGCILEYNQLINLAPLLGIHIK